MNGGKVSLNRRTIGSPSSIQPSPTAIFPDPEPIWTSATGKSRYIIAWLNPGLQLIGLVPPDFAKYRRQKGSAPSVIEEHLANCRGPSTPRPEFHH